MTAPAPPRPIREEVARVIVETAIASGQRGIPNWDHAHLYERHGRTFREVALMEARAALAIVAAICREECAEIRREADLASMAAPQLDAIEQRALVAWRLAEIFEGRGDG